MLSQLTRILL